MFAKSDLLAAGVTEIKLKRELAVIRKYATLVRKKGLKPSKTYRVNRAMRYKACKRDIKTLTYNE